MDPQRLGRYEVKQDFEKGFYTVGCLEDGSIADQRVNGAHLKVYLSSTIVKVSTIISLLYNII